jgi:hypothetical protein
MSDDECNLDERLAALTKEHSDLHRTIDGLNIALHDANVAIDTRFKHVAMPWADWMINIADDMVFNLRLHHVSDLRKVSKGKLKKLGISREGLKLLVDYVTTPEAELVKWLDPWKSDEACWYEAQDRLWGFGAE